MGGGLPSVAHYYAVCPFESIVTDSLFFVHSRLSHNQTVQMITDEECSVLLSGAKLFASSKQFTVIS